MTLTILFSGITSGFITFRMSGMRLAPHFGAMILALIVTLAGIVTGNILVVYAAAALQAIAALTAFTQTWAVLKYNFQTSPAYAPHLALMGMLPVLAIASVL
ncbi:MAG: DUF5400 domain-containing protein [Methanobacterium sp.]|nr:DUF5400 domain-containing protein [Euryarchaeota archaeon]MBV1728910.1 DUF5400 domain-containing protein [Methanobacterium sp.]